jgi:predicted permease
VTGGALGVAVAFAVNWAMRRFLVVRLPRFEQVAIDGRVLAFAVALSVLTGLAFGLVPGLRASRGDIRGALHEGGRGVFGSIRRDRLRRSLVIGEVALSFVLLVGAGLLIKSFGLLLAVPLGFDPERIVTSYVALPPGRYADSTKQRAFYRQALESMTSLPGVTAAAFASNLPIEGGVNGGVAIEGREFPSGEGPVAEKRIVSTNYFQVMRAKAVAGRLFDSREVAGGPPAAIVNQAFVRRWFPGANPIGKRVDFAWDTQGMQTIVGVVADVREGALDQAIAPAIYIPVEHRASSGMYLIVRSSIDARALMGAVQRKLHEIDRDLPLSEVRTLSAVMQTSVAGHTLTASILGTFAALALVLAGVGLYGVISYSVVQRTQELGIRAALGAQRVDLLRLVLRQGVGFVAAGFAIGLAASLGFGTLIAKQLYGIGPTDPATFALVAALLAAVALLATAVPAMRATRADPLRALREE